MNIYRETENRIMIAMPETTKAPEWFQEFEIRNDRRLDRIEKGIRDIKNCPTIKKELTDESK